MQLFVLDYDPGRAAVMLCDVHLRKMCLETAQILSSVLFRQGRGLLPEMPKAYNPAHPVIRAVDTPQKINWVLLYNYALHGEYFGTAKSMPTLSFAENMIICCIKIKSKQPLQT